MEIGYIVIGYLVGFFLTLTFFKFFGKKIGFDYDPPHCEWYDDWQSNASAYFSFSIGWILVVPALIIFGLVKLLIEATRWYLKLGNKKHQICKHKIDGECPYHNLQCAWPDCETK